MIDVDEKGTEAAAATVIITKISGYRSEEPIEFKADKPFTYYILDDSGNVYFAGTVCKSRITKKAPKGAFLCYFSILTVFSDFCFLWHNRVVHFIFFHIFKSDCKHKFNTVKLINFTCTRVVVNRNDIGLRVLSAKFLNHTLTCNVV